MERTNDLINKYGKVDNPIKSNNCTDRISVLAVRKMKMRIFCVCCKKHTENKDDVTEYVILTNKRSALRNTCSECDNTKYTFISQHGTDSVFNV